MISAASSAREAAELSASGGRPRPMRRGARPACCCSDRSLLGLLQDSCAQGAAAPPGSVAGGPRPTARPGPRWRTRRTRRADHRRRRGSTTLRSRRVRERSGRPVRALRAPRRSTGRWPRVRVRRDRAVQWRVLPAVASAGCAVSRSGPAAPVAAGSAPSASRLDRAAVRSRGRARRAGESGAGVRRCPLGELDEGGGAVVVVALGQRVPAAARPGRALFVLVVAHDSALPSARRASAATVRRRCSTAGGSGCHGAVLRGGRVGDAGRRDVLPEGVQRLGGEAALAVPVDQRGDPVLGLQGPQRHRRYGADRAAHSAPGGVEDERRRTRWRGRGRSGRSPSGRPAGRAAAARARSR